MGKDPKKMKPLEQEVENEFEKDRDSVRNYVKIIARTDYRIELQR